MFANQSKTVSLLQLSDEQVPLLLQPPGFPSLPVPQLLQAILYIEPFKGVNLLKKILRVNIHYLFLRGIGVGFKK
jgi:hypothetical protein